jgi:hypothetical protein
MDPNDLLREIKGKKQGSIRECPELRNLVKAFCFKLLAETESRKPPQALGGTEAGKSTQIGDTYWLIGRYVDIVDFNTAVQDSILERQAGSAYIRTGHRKIDPINRHNSHIVQLQMPNNRNDARNPTAFQQKKVDALDSCHIVDKSLVRDLFTQIGKPPIELEDDNLPCFAGTMHMNRYRDNLSIRQVTDPFFSGKRVNDQRRKVLSELRIAGADKSKKKIAWQSATSFVTHLYRDEPCLAGVSEIILKYAAERAGL